MRINEEMFQSILLELAEGESIKTCLNKRSLSMMAFYTHLEENPQLQVQYDKAMTVKVEGHAQEITSIADTDENPAKARNRIEARKWLAAKVNPQRFGERLEINVTKTIDLKAAMLEGQRRIRDVNQSDVLLQRDLENSIDVQHVETTSTINSRSTGQQPIEQPKSNRLAEEIPSEIDEDDIFS